MARRTATSSLFPMRKEAEKVPAIEEQIRDHGLPEPAQEHAFAKHIGRKWLFDYAWPEYQIAFEVEGGGFGRYIVITSGFERKRGQTIPIKPGTAIRFGGRHNTGAGMEADCVKYSWAAILGWCVIRATTTMIRDGIAITNLVEAFRAKGVQIQERTQKMHRTLLVVLTLFAIGCSSVSPDAGTEAVLIRKPWFFGDGGVDDTPIKPGLQYVAISTDHVIVTTQPVAFQQAFDNMNSKDGVPLDFNAQMTLMVTDSVRLVKEFGANETRCSDEQRGHPDCGRVSLRDIYDKNLAKEFESVTRRAVRNFAEVDIATTAIDRIDDEVEKAMQAHIKRINIPLQLREITVGKANPPAEILQQRVETAAQRQRKNTEDERNLAEIARKTAEESRAAADRAYNDKMGISETQNVELRKTQLIAEACGSKGGCTFLLGGGITPLLQIR